MRRHSLYATNACLSLVVFALSCPAASSDSIFFPPLPRTHLRPSHASSMPNAICSVHERKQLIEQTFLTQRKKATKLLVDTMALLTEGYNGSEVQNIVRRVSEHDRCLAPLTDYVLVAELLWPVVAEYDKSNTTAMHIKAEILRHLAEGDVFPQKPSLLKKLSKSYAFRRHQRPANDPQSSVSEPCSISFGQTLSYPQLRHVHQTETVLRIGRRLIQLLNAGSFTPTDCRAMLFSGPSGIGKTHMIHAIANESNSMLTRVTAPELLNLYKSAGTGAIKKLLTKLDSDREKHTGQSALLHIDEIGPLEFQNGSMQETLQAALVALWEELEKIENENKKVLCIGECLKHVRGGDHDPALVQYVEFSPLNEMLLQKVIEDAAQACQLECTQEQICAYTKKMFNWGAQEAVRFIKQVKKVSQIAENSGQGLPVAGHKWLDHATKQVLRAKNYERKSCPLLDHVHLPDQLKAFMYNLVEQLQIGTLNRQQQRMLLFCGPEGTGKTMMINALRNESGCNCSAIGVDRLVQSYEVEKDQAIQNLLNHLVSRQTTGKCSILHLRGLKYLTFDDNTSSPTLLQALAVLGDMLQSPQYRDSGILCIGECNLYTRVQGSRGPRAQCVYFQKPTPDLLQKIFKDQQQKLDLEMSQAQVQQCLSHMTQWSGHEVAQFLEKLPAQLQESGLPLDNVLEKLFAPAEAYPLLRHMHQPESIMNTVRELVQHLKNGLLSPVDPRGLILYGPPGVGKTEMVHAMINEAGCQSIIRSASTLVTEYQGSGANAIQDVFDEATANRGVGQAVIIFFDELESIQVADEEANRPHGDTAKAMVTLWTILNTCEWDRRRQHILFVAACNNFDCLDTRIKERCQSLQFSLPSQSALKRIMKDKAQKLEFPLSDEVIDSFAPLMSNWNGRNATRFIKEAVRLAHSSNRPVIRMHSRVNAFLSGFLGYELDPTFRYRRYRENDLFFVIRILRGQPTMRLAHPYELELALAFEKEAAAISRRTWSHFWKRLRKAHPITVIATGATAIIFSPAASPVGAAVGHAVETYLYDENGR